MESLVAIELLADERVDAVLRTLVAAPLTPKELEHAIPVVPHASLSDLLRDLDDHGVVRRLPAEASCSAVRYGLSEAGIALIRVFDVAGEWGVLANGASARVPVTTVAKALAAAWKGGIASLLALEPRSQRELTQDVGLTHHQVEGRVTAMVRAGLVERVGGRKPLRYAFTEHGREGVSLVVEGIMWERGHGTTDAPGTEALARALSVALPLLEFPEDVNGVCTLTLEDKGFPSAVVTVEIADGQVVSASCAVGDTPTAWAHGDIDAWVRALHTGRPRGIVTGGDRSLVAEIVDGLSMRLYAGRRAS